MKKIVAFLVLLLCLSTFSQAQTTWTEYRYVTAGLKDDISKGKDIKAGYVLTELGTSSGVTLEGITRYAQVFSFKIRGGTTKAFAVKCSDSEGNFSYFCIPTATATNDIWDAAFKAISESGKEWTMVFAWALAKTISQNL